MGGISARKRHCIKMSKASILAKRRKKDSGVDGSGGKVGEGGVMSGVEVGGVSGALDGIKSGTMIGGGKERAGDKEGGGGRRARGGRIPQGVQEQARRKDSPVINELLVEARKGRTKLVVQQDPDKAGGGGRRAQGGHIPQEVQKQARQKDSPVVSEVLVEARKGCTELVVQLLQQDPDKAAVTDRHGRTCFHLACISGHLKTALAILQSGAIPIDSTTKRGHTALHECCQEGHIHLSLLLISLGANLHSRSREGWTPLMCACSRGHMQLASIVVAAGGDMNDTTRIGLTPLHIAAWKGHTAVVQMLLHCGSDPLAVSHNDETAQQLASEEEHRDTATILQTATAKVSQEPACRISSLEGQLRLCQEKLAEALTQVLMTERQHREEKERSLLREIEQEKTRGEILETQVKGERSGASDPMEGQNSPMRKPLLKSASSSDLVDHQTTPTARQPVNTALQSLSPHGERPSITDMVSECLHNPSSMANIRSNLKADNQESRESSTTRHHPIYQQ